jgi:hypothetical protein
MFVHEAFAKAGQPLLMGSGGDLWHHPTVTGMFGLPPGFHGQESPVLHEGHRGIIAGAFDCQYQGHFGGGQGVVSAKMPLF